MRVLGRFFESPCRTCTSRCTSCQLQRPHFVWARGSSHGPAAPPFGGCFAGGQATPTAPWLWVFHPRRQVGAKALPFGPACPPASRPGGRASPPTSFLTECRLRLQSFGQKLVGSPTRRPPGPGASPPNFWLHGRLSPSAPSFDRGPEIGARASPRCNCGLRPPARYRAPAALCASDCRS